MDLARICSVARDALWTACNNGGLEAVMKQISTKRAQKAQKPAEQPRSFRHSPSVGTWMMLPSSAASQVQSQPAEEPVAAQKVLQVQSQPAEAPLAAQKVELLYTSASLQEKLDQLERPVSPSSSMKTPGRVKRRVFGGMSRATPSPEMPEASSTPSLAHSPTQERLWSMAGSPANTLRRQCKDPPAPNTFRLDYADESEGKGLTRKTSLTAMFETMGSAELYRMDEGEEASADHWSTRARSTQLSSYFSKLEVPSTPNGRSMCKSASTPSFSAMSMDLGRPGSSSAFARDFKAQAPEPARLPTPSMGSRCSSVGALKPLKVSKSGKQAGLLPMLAKPGNSAADWSVGHSVSMNMSKRTHGWSTMGAAPIF